MTNVLNVEDLISATAKCQKGVLWKDSVAQFSLHRFERCNKLIDELDSGKYKLSPYSVFDIYEPKHREICSTRFRDRVVQKALNDWGLRDAMSKDFILDNMACQVGKGTDKARARLQKHLRDYVNKKGVNGYALKLDIHNFFGSTPHSTIKKAYAKCVKDAWVRGQMFKVVDSFGDGVGAGLGSELTQISQLAILSPCDHYIKEQLHVKWYCRYMDDFVLVSDSKEHLKYCLAELVKVLESLGLTLNGNKTKITTLKQGVNYLGFKYKVTESGKVLITRLSSKYKRTKRLMRARARLVKSGRMSLEKFKDCYRTMREGIGYSECEYRKKKPNRPKTSNYYLLQRLDRLYKALLLEVENATY